MTEEKAKPYKVLRSGQTRRYGDSERQVEVYLEKGLTKEQASDIVREMGIGFDDTPNKDWYEERLTYFRETSPGTWEFCMVRAYLG